VLDGHDDGGSGREGATDLHIYDSKTAPLGLLDGDQMTVTGRYTISLAQPITSPNRDQ
jgi:hypothetical protein